MKFTLPTPRLIFTGFRATPFQRKMATTAEESTITYEELNDLSAEFEDVDTELGMSTFDPALLDDVLVSSHLVSRPSFAMYPA